MKNKIRQTELEEALNNLDISYASKKIFISTLRQNNETLASGYIPVIGGIISVISFFLLLYLHMSGAEGWSVTPVTLMLQLNMATIFLFTGIHKIKSIKMNRSVIELIIKANNRCS